MTSALEVRIANPDERLPLYRMLELYQHDLTDVWDQDIDTHGEYGYTLDRYWKDSDCWGYLFRVAGNLAGFALVDRRVRIPGDDFWMDQFFVLKKYRRQGIGSAAAVAVLDAHHGHWQVGQMPANLAAQAFWRRLVSSYTHNGYTEEKLTTGWWHGYVQRFRSPRRNDA